jgi:hypothetical protein
MADEEDDIDYTDKDTFGDGFSTSTKGDTSALVDVSQFGRTPVPATHVTDDIVAAGTKNLMSDLQKQGAAMLGTPTQNPSVDYSDVTKYGAGVSESGAPEYRPRRYSYEYDPAGNIVKAIPLAEPGRYIGEGTHKVWMPGEVFTEQERQAISKEATRPFEEMKSQAWQAFKEGRGLKTNQEIMESQPAGDMAPQQEPTTLGEKMIQARRLKKLKLLPKSLLDQYLNPDLSYLAE